MHPESAFDRSNRWRLLLALSFVPLLVKSVDYVVLGSYVPLLVLCLFGGLVSWGIRQSPKVRGRVIKAWAVALVSWGLARFTVMGLFLFTSVSEAHIESQFTTWFVVLSIAHIAFGVYLFRRRGLGN